MPKINEFFEPVSKTDQRPKCKVCGAISKDTSSSTSGKWKHFRAKHDKHPVLEHDPQRKRKAEEDSNPKEPKQPKVRKL